LFLGTYGSATYLAAVLTDPEDAGDAADAAGEDDPDAAAPGLAACTWSALREVGHLLGDRDADLATTAVALSEWHRHTTRCPRCGAPTRVELGGWVRRCSVDGGEEYPRTDAAVIMAVTDDADRILLAHGAQWAERRFSTLAGFVEPGESLETAVRREVAEEVGVRVAEVAYVASQPWPFPASLMVGFRAHATTTQITLDAHEVTDARWFTREELGRAVVDGTVTLPMPTSIARALIEGWFGGPLPVPAAR
jgi:NAD+ diphosphatase